MRNNSRSEDRCARSNIQHPPGTTIAKFVPTSAFPFAGIEQSSAAYRSYPAANALPLVGALALSLKNLTRRAGSAVTGGMTGLEVDEGAIGVVGRHWVEFGAFGKR